MMKRLPFVLAGWFSCFGHVAAGAEPPKVCPVAFPPSLHMDGFTGGDERGNGGGVIVCRDNGRLTSIELLDYWEQRKLYCVLPRGIKTDDPIDYAKKSLYQVRILSPQRALAYEKFIDRFMEQIQWVDADLGEIPDILSPLRAPHGCTFDQLIIRQKRISVPEDRLFIVSRPLWDAMSAPYQGGAILHEAFYDEALAAGHTNSRLARYFQVKMHSKGIEKVTDKEYAQIVTGTEFPFWEFRQAFQRSLNGNRFESFSDEQMKFDNSGALLSIDAREDARLELFHPLLGLKAHGSDTRDPHYSLFVKQINFTRGTDGETVSAVLSDSKDLGSPYVILNGQRVKLAVPSEITILPDSSLRLKLSGCYEDPGSHRSYCGEIVVNSAGSARSI